MNPSNDQEGMTVHDPALESYDEEYRPDIGPQVTMVLAVWASITFLTVLAIVHLKHGDVTTFAAVVVGPVPMLWRLSNKIVDSMTRKILR